MGSNKGLVIETMSRLAKHYSYKAKTMRMSEIIQAHVQVQDTKNDEYTRVKLLIEAGNKLRETAGDNSLLAKLTAIEIAKARAQESHPRMIYLVDSIKHPQEVQELRDIYGGGFYLFAIHSSQKSRDDFLKNNCHVKEKAKRDELMDRDQDENLGHGQSTRDAFHLADFFVTENGNANKVWTSLQRFFDLIFGDPYCTPTFDEFAMFMAHAASMKSADMSRQVGAVITQDNDIIATGANECPRPGGGTYWPVFDHETNQIEDVEGGRDFVRNEDRNAKEKQQIINALKRDLDAAALQKLEANILESGLNDITEYGRVVHAEMDALLSCARRGISCQHSVLFSTTYPCHNCAKHIVASGIQTVYYIEPYPKSRALDMHPDAIGTPDDGGKPGRVIFRPFVGVGPRQFINLFSLTLGVGERLRRKQTDSFKRVAWDREHARPRVRMYPASYKDREQLVATAMSETIPKLGPLSVKLPAVGS
jgi:deoxycytidylate deaminase